MPSPFEPDEVPTKPEGFKNTVRLMVERLLAFDTSDLAVLIQMRIEAIGAGRRGPVWHKYRELCASFVETLLK
jgi:hypothetical protein